MRAGPREGSRLTLRRLLLLGLCLLAAAATCAYASGSKVWGMDAQELSGQLARSDYSALRHVSFGTHSVRDAERLGDDASFALGVIYSELGMNDAAEDLLSLAFERAPEPWRGAAFDRLVNLYRDSDRYADLESLVLSESGVRADLALVEALYEQEKYPEVEARLVEKLPGLRDELSPVDARLQEAALWWAVSRIEQDRPDWPDHVRALYRDYPSAHVHSRLWVYLINRSELLEPFAPGEVSFFRAKQLRSEGRTGEAATELFTLARDVPASAAGDLLLSPWGILEVYGAGAGSGRMTEAASALVGLARAAEAGDRTDLARRAYEYAGRLHRLRGAYAEAVRLLERSLALEPPPGDEQRVRWYALSAALRGDPVGTAARLAGIVPTLSDPAYFGDALGELVGLLAERERWDALLQAYHAIVDFAEPGVLARYELAIARAIETGRLPSAQNRAGELRARYLERAASQRENVFAALVAGALLGRDGVDLLAVHEAEPAAREPDPASRGFGEYDGGEGAEAAMLASTYLRFGLTDDLVSVVRGAGDAVGPELRTAAAERLAAAGLIRESILALSGLEAAGGALTRARAELRYPLAYAAIADRRVAAESIDRATFYALIREESLFDPGIGSRAGAVGLSQLIPTTAADIARRMRLEDPVLTDPADNLAIGARYFSMLTDQFGTVARAIAAYNAGQGNVRRWERSRGSLDEILFHQSIPFEETYNHVRKVVVSAAYYGYLYANRAPAETVRLIFALDEG
ncbi:MAG: flagellar assembly lytic transglycosylase [Spirochaetota bacterium]